MPRRRASRTSTRRSPCRRHRWRQSASQVQQQQAGLTFAQQQASRYANLAKDGWGTVQDAQQYTSQQRQGEAALRSAQSAVVAAARQLVVLKAQRGSAEANLAQADAQRDQAKLNLSYTIVTAAQPGRVVQLSGAVGQYAQPGTALTMFVPDDIWVTANFKETQLDHMRPGQQVTLRHRRLSGSDDRGPCRQRAARLRHRLLAAAGGECHRQLRQGRPARAGEDRARRSAGRCCAWPGHVGGAERPRRSAPVARRAAGTVRCERRRAERRFRRRRARPPTLG